MDMACVDSRQICATNEQVAWAQQGEATLIQDEVRRLDDLIYRLNQNRATLLRRLNNIQAATRRLPPEVLSTIFQFARPPIDFSTRITPAEYPDDPDLRRDTYDHEEDFHFNLAAVSYRWRQIVWSTPQLWTTISVEVYETAAENNASILNLYFQNARALPMTIELDLRAQLMLLSGAEDAERRAKSISLLEPVKTAVFMRNAAKIQNIILTGLPIEWAPSIDKNFSQCQSVTLYWPPLHTRGWGENRGSVNLTELPRLHRIRLKELLTPLKLSWSTITVLHLQDMPIKTCVDSLVNCPNLIEFESLHPLSAAVQDDSPTLTQPIMLEHLESLTWHTTGDQWSYAFFHHIRFSKLRNLRWSGAHQSLFDDFSEDIYAPFISFFSNLPSTLTSLTFSHFPYHSFGIMKDLLNSVPRLPELRFVQCSTATVAMAVSMIGRPLAALVEDSANRRAAIDTTKSEGPKVLASLRSFASQSYCNPDPAMIVEMLEALHRAGTSRERFCLVLSDGDPWQPEILARVKTLVFSGFDLEITLGSHTLYLTPPSVGLAV